MKNKADGSHTENVAAAAHEPPHMSAIGGKADPHRKMSANEKCMLTNGNPTGVLR